jgi:hypothetical protein
VNARSDEPRKPEDAPRTRGTSDEPFDPYDVGPTRDEVERWAEEERRRRQQWVAGPSEHEKRAWALREQAQRIAEIRALAGPAGYDRDPFAAECRTDAQYATLGLWRAFMEWPCVMWSTMLRSGRDWETRSYGPGTRRRIRLDDWPDRP